MKFISVFTLLFIAVFSAVFAEDVELYMSAPAEGSVFHNGDTIEFVIDDMSMDEFDTLEAKLYKVDDESDEAQIYLFTGSKIEGEYRFTWNVESEAGNYFVRVYEIDGEDHLEENRTRTYNFVIEGDNDGENSGEENSGENQEQSAVEEAATVITTPVRRRKRSIYA